MLRLENLTKRFGSKTAVEDVSLELTTGSFVGVIGRSGAGKSTLLRAINRLSDASSGRIYFDGIDRMLKLQESIGNVQPPYNVEKFTDLRFLPDDLKEPVR